MMIDFPNLFSDINKLYISAILILMFANWGLEALKWKLLIDPLESITFSSSFKSVFAGITVSIFTPNRTGEFAGRVFFLQKADKIQATVMSLAGSVLQLGVTIIAGVVAYFILENKYYDYFKTEQFISGTSILLLLSLLVLIVVIIFIVFKLKDHKIIRLKKYTNVFKMHSKNRLSFIFYLSGIRYIVFSIQYYLALKIFGITGGITIIFSLIALTFFVTSAIPTFALSEIAVRAGVAIYFFETICQNRVAIVSSSLFLWIINLALPALIGSIFVWKLKFFKD
ncbi:MAG: lysylphosphatidylglycerol synthase domain-containing protein [Bacteroidia bacterium]